MLALDLLLVCSKWGKHTIVNAFKKWWLRWKDFIRQNIKRVLWDSHSFLRKVRSNSRRQHADLSNCLASVAPSLAHCSSITIVTDNATIPLISHVGSGCENSRNNCELLPPELPSSFFTQLLLSLARWTTESITANVFKERPSENVSCYCYLKDSSHCSSLWRESFHSAFGYSHYNVIYNSQKYIWMHTGMALFYEPVSFLFISSI